MSEATSVMTRGIAACAISMSRRFCGSALEHSSAAVRIERAEHRRDACSQILQVSEFFERQLQEAIVPIISRSPIAPIVAIRNTRS